MSIIRLPARGYLVAISLLLLLLTACGMRVDQTVTFYDDQSWEAEIVVAVPPELMALSGGAAAELDAEIARLAEEMETAGARVSYETQQEDGRQSYHIVVEGNGIDVLQQIAFEDADIRVRSVDGQQRVEFAMLVPYNLNIGTITLIGDEIVSSNGRVVEKGKVQWTNTSGRIEAVLVPKSRFGASTLLFPVAVGSMLVVAGAGFYFLRRRQAPAARFCGRCGASMEHDARFCPACGHRN